MADLAPSATRSGSEGHPLRAWTGLSRTLIGTMPATIGTKMRQHRNLTIAGLMASAAMLIAGSAAAHAHLVKSNPAANATVPAPKTISLTFNEKLTPAFSKFELSMPAMKGMKVKMKTVVSKDHLTIVGKPQGKLMPGAYTINWHAASSDDGHKIDGTVAFTVN